MTDQGEEPGPVRVHGPLAKVLADIAAKREVRRAQGLLPADEGQSGTWCAVHECFHACMECHDTRWRWREGWEGPEPEQRCRSEVCLPWWRQQAQRGLESSDIGRRMDQRLETFHARSWQRPAYDCALRMVQSTPPHGMLYLVGVNASGKTHLARALCCAAVENGYGALFYRMSSLLARLRETFETNSQMPLTFYQALREVKEVDMLALDDLDQEQTTAWTNEVKFEILNHRYDHADEKATVITSNIMVRELSKTLGSRLTDAQRSQVCLIVGQRDLRARPVEDEALQEVQFDMQARERDEHFVRERVRICPVCNCLPCHRECPWQGRSACERD